MNLNKWLNQVCGCSKHPQSPACVHEMAKALNRLRDLLKINEEYGYLDIPLEAIEKVLEG